MLCLQLRRGFWSPTGHYCKVAGHVRFPLLLPLPRDTVPLLGHGTVAVRGQRQHQGRQQEEEEGEEGEEPPLYQLRAVAVHHGSLAGGGHYTVFRRLDAGQPSRNTSSSSHTGGAGTWVRASDESVVPAEVGEVLRAEAALLVYERLP